MSGDELKGVYLSSRNLSIEDTMRLASPSIMPLIPAWMIWVLTFVSSLASTFYLVAHGFAHWHTQIGLVFLSLIVAVVIPCTLSDLVVPMTFARAGRGNEKHKT